MSLDKFPQSIYCSKRNKFSDLNVEYVVTEENDDDDEEDDDESDEANVYDEIAIKKEEEEFANLDKILMKQVCS